MSWTTPRTWTTGELVTAAIMNAHVRDDLNALYRVCVRKTADESVTSSAVLQDDDQLLWAIAASEVWAFQFHVLYDGGSSGDLQTAVAGPSGVTVNYGSLGLGTSTTDPGNLVVNSDNLNGGGSRMDVGALGTGSILYTIIGGSLVNGSTAGNAKLQWAQSVSNGTATTVRAGSFLIAHRIS